MNFADALNVNSSDVERPVPHPKGTYVFQVTKQATLGSIKSEKGEWDTVTFPVRAVDVKDDVNQDDLAKAGGVKALSARVQFMFDTGPSDESKANFAKTQFQMTRFLTEHLGLGQGTLRELIDKAQGSKFVGTGDHRPDKTDKEIVYFEISRTAPVA